ncbi:MAG: hypothetical protein QXF26_05785 [Candidatus Bathyarchaeia archaeon]
MAEVVSAATAIAQILLQIYEKRGELTESLRKTLKRIGRESDERKIPEILRQELSGPEADRVKRDIELIKESLCGLGECGDLVIMSRLIRDLPEVPYARVWQEFEKRVKELLTRLGIPELELGGLPFGTPGPVEFSFHVGARRGFYAKSDESPCDIWAEVYLLNLDMGPAYGVHQVELTIDLIKKVMTRTLSRLREAYEATLKRRREEAEEVRRMLETLTKGAEV